MADRLLAWLFTVSCVAAYAVQKFARDLPYNAMELPLLSMAASRHAVAMLQGRDARLIDEGDGVGPESLKGV